MRNSRQSHVTDDAERVTRATHATTLTCMGANEPGSTVRSVGVST
jgi:hypothetical protein